MTGVFSIHLKTQESISKCCGVSRKNITQINYLTEHEAVIIRLASFIYFHKFRIFSKILKPTFAIILRNNAMPLNKKCH